MHVLLWEEKTKQAQKPANKQNKTKQKTKTNQSYFGNFDQ